MTRTEAATPTTRIGETESVLEVLDFSGGFVGADGAVTPVLDEVSFSIRRSSLTAIVGETGSGKSIMALSILGVPPQSFHRTSGQCAEFGDRRSASSSKTPAPR
jgi:ABC-type glutathione transport system ATPase component